MKKFIFSISAFILMNVSMPIMFVQAETLGHAVEQCSSIENALERLVCFDNMAKKLNHYDDDKLVTLAPVTTPKNEIKKVDEKSEKAIERQKVEEFGIAQKSSYFKGDSLVAEVKSVTVLNTKKLRIVLRDGHVWQQTSSERFSRLKAGDTVEIAKGAVGAFYLKKQGKKSRIRVKRIQ